MNDKSTRKREQDDMNGDDGISLKLIIWFMTYIFAKCKFETIWYTIEHERYTESLFEI